jgi:hypothetical protein
MFLACQWCLKAAPGAPRTEAMVAASRNDANRTEAVSKALKDGHWTEIFYQFVATNATKSDKILPSGYLT